MSTYLVAAAPPHPFHTRKHPASPQAGMVHGATGKRVNGVKGIGEKWKGGGLTQTLPYHPATPLLAPTIPHSYPLLARGVARGRQGGSQGVGNGGRQEVGTRVAKR